MAAEDIIKKRKARKYGLLFLAYRIYKMYDLPHLVNCLQVDSISDDTRKATVIAIEMHGDNAYAQSVVDKLNRFYTS